MSIKVCIHSLKDENHGRHALGGITITGNVGDHLYLAEINGVQRTASLNFFIGSHDDVYGVQKEIPYAQDSE